MSMAKALLLLLLVVQILSLVAAARPLEGAAGLTGNGIGGMVTELLRAAKSGPNPPTHCC